MHTKPWSEACARNREPILQVLREHFLKPGWVLEIGSGTGQHAAWFAPALPHLVWQPSDREENLPGIRAWCAEADCRNLRPPLVLDVDQPWPVQACDYVFSANTVHIMGWASVERLFQGVGRYLAPGGLFVLYGPFHYGGRPTSESNAAFDAQLRRRDPAMGIRDYEALNALAGRNGLEKVADHALPANNHALVWRRLND
ncbi:DUF938 domain-containing protein [Alkalilimnicola sp. S0819]|uniref:DUF938 domain-containing protein n=1 Tax=Alkalilimnicola sp. S0819 TaxID=2613922 RepID=UPI0012627B2A|nr:DUF938 domain-containing protein [Alkalilimnicola sp. S0819]KAB7628390.1 DUF938 domain-containing protein [Alkalilimnicola sp. S0819]MPQ15293.1 DUF938 domain-containing protein [Alkalilimnicola sp. S0819]